MAPKFKEEQVTRSARAKEDLWFRQNEQQLCETALEKLEAERKRTADKKRKDNEEPGNK